MGNSHRIELPQDFLHHHAFPWCSHLRVAERGVPVGKTQQGVEEPCISQMPSWVFDHTFERILCVGGHAPLNEAGTPSSLCSGGGTSNGIRHRAGGDPTPLEEANGMRNFCVMPGCGKGRVFSLCFIGIRFSMVG